MDMGERVARWCVFLPCSDKETWAVPQNALGEILTVHDAQEQPPAEIEWRGHQLPVLDLGAESELPWRESHDGSGRLAVILGLEGQEHPYWAVALRGDGLAMDPLSDDAVQAAEEEAVALHALGAFRLRGQLYQIPDLAEIPGIMLQEQRITEAP